MDIRRGIIRAFDSGTYLAEVQIVGSMATMLSGVPVAKQIGADLITSGAKCGVLFFDETNPSDGCVVFIYGEPHPGHITIPQGKEFRPGGDANTAFGEDGSGNAYFKDAIIGTWVAPKSARHSSTSTLTLTTIHQDIPGCSATFTPPYACKALVIGTFAFQCQAIVDPWLNAADGRLMVDGVDAGEPWPSYVVHHQWDAVSVSGFWVKSLSAAQHTLKLQAKKSYDRDTMVAGMWNCVLTYVLLPNA